MSGLRLSAIVIVYNEFGRINTCLASLYGQVDEIILIDDGSDQKRDELITLYSYWSEIFWSSGIRLKLLLEEHKGNHGKYLSQAFEHVTGDWIIQLDGDEILVTEKPGVLKAIAEEFSRLGCVGLKCNLYNYHQDGNSFKIGNVEDKTRVYKRDSGYYPKRYAIEWKFNNPDALICGFTEFHINHIRTSKEKKIDEIEYYKKFIEGYKESQDEAEKKYYRDSFRWVGEYYKWKCCDIDEAIKFPCITDEVS